MNKNLEIIARDEVDAATARTIISSVLSVKDGYLDIYDALCRGTWRITIECCLDSELRSWHRLLLDTAAQIEAQSKSSVSKQNDISMDAISVSERIRALADIVKLSVDAGVATDLNSFLSRAHVSEILQLLASAKANPLDKQQIKAQLNLGNDNYLSRVLTLLIANGIVERIHQDNSVFYCVSGRGLSLINRQ